ncbi:MAG: hypothetical protein RSD27_10360 [Ruthenibacterium sp.]
MFCAVKRDFADVEPTAYLPGADGLVAGEAAVLTAGALAKCGASVKPTHIAMGTKNKAGRYPAIRVLPTTVFEAPCSAAIAAVGSIVTIGADALSVTATTASGVFTVEDTENAADTMVRGRFM